jgi:hemoglobin
MPDTLYKRLGRYDAIAAVCDDLLPRLMGDAQLARFWQNRAQDSIRREKQLLVDFLCSCDLLLNPGSRLGHPAG